MGQSIAILIGNTIYDNLTELACCANDVAQVHDLLSATEKFSLIVEFVDKPVSTVNDRIRKLVEEFSEEEVEEVFLFFTGHGQSNADDFYMCFKGFTQSSPNFTGLSRENALEMIRLFKAKLSVVVIDACEAGRNLIKSDRDPVAFPLKSAFTDFIQFSSCTESQSSMGGQQISFFTDKFVKACLLKEQGAVYYSDVENALRDAFLNDSNQTPHFIRQSTSQEKFCNDASRLDGIRKEYLKPSSNDDKREQPELPVTTFVLARQAIEVIDKSIPTKECAQAFIDGVFDAASSNSEHMEGIEDFYKVRTVRYDDFHEVQNKQSVVSLLKSSSASDSFVEGWLDRKIRPKPSFGLTGSYSSLATLGMPDEYDETYYLFNHCELTSVHVGIYFEPKFMALKRLFSEIVFLPRLTECLILTHETREPRSGWKSFDENERTKHWSWSDHLWTADPAEVTSKFIPDPYDFARQYILSFGK